MFIAALFTIAKTWKQPKCLLMNDWIRKMLYVSVYMYLCVYAYNTMQYHSAIKKGNLAVYDNIGGPCLLSQTEKDK